MSYNGQFTVEYSWGYLEDPEDLTDWVISADMMVGRHRIIDRWEPSNVTVVLRNPQNVNPLVVGRYIIVNGIGFSIVSIQRSYGIPFNALTDDAPADLVTITGSSSGLWAAARIKYIDYTAAANTIKEYAYTATQNISGGAAPTFYGPAWDTFTCKATNFNGTSLDLLNSILTGVVGYVQDPGGFESIIANNPINLASSGALASTIGANFTDTGSQSSSTKTYFYDEIQFLANTETDAGKVLITYNVGANSVTSASGAGNQYQTDTLLNTGSQAQQAADVLYSILGVDEIGPYSVSTTSGIYGSFNLPTQAAYDMIGKGITVTFRGDTYNAICEGFSVSQDVERARYTFYLSPALAVPLILDSTAFGILDTNTLGIG
jgi:hypothetical protein